MNFTINKSSAILLVFLVLSALSGISLAQNNSPFNQRDDKYRLLGLKRAHEAYQVALAEYGRQQELFRRHLINQAELDQAKNVFSDAEVNYQQSLLAVLFEQQYVSVKGAVKYQGEDGSRNVRLTLENTSGGSAEFKHLLDMEDELFKSLKPELIHNVYVSLLNDDGAIISQPYETKIEELKYQEPVTLEFTMLQDLDEVTVYLIYSNGTERNFKIFLQKDESVNQVFVQSEQFSQEVELGESATYDLTLELFSASNDSYSLEVVNLPRQIGRYFTDPAGRVRLTQVKFTESTQSKRAALEITLPDRPTDDVRMDEPITFYALAAPRTTIKAIRDFHTRQWTEEGLKALDVGYVRLELLPRGKGELLVRAPLLYRSITSEESVSFDVNLVNEGTHRVDDITFDLELPLRWRKQIDPPAIPALDIGAEQQIIVTLLPPEDITEGRYDIRLRTNAMSNNQPLIGGDKTFTVEVRSETNVLSASVIAVVLLGLLGGIVVFGLKLSKR